MPSLATAGYKDDFLDAGIDCFLNHVLDRWNVYDRQKFLRHGFRCRQKARAQAGYGDNCFSNFHSLANRLSHPFGFSLGNFLAGLAIDTEGRHRASLESFNADLFAALFTDAEFAGFQSLQSLLDLEDQLSLAIAYSQDRITIGFHGSAIAWIGKVFVLVHILDRLAGFGPEFLDPSGSASRGKIQLLFCSMDFGPQHNHA